MPAVLRVLEDAWGRSLLPHVQLPIEIFTRYTEDLWSAWSTWIAWYSLTTRWATPAESYHILMDVIFSASE